MLVWLLEDEWECISLGVTGRYVVELKGNAVGSLVEYAEGVEGSWVEYKFNYFSILHVIIVIININYS